MVGVMNHPNTEHIRYLSPHCRGFVFSFRTKFILYVSLIDCHFKKDYALLNKTWFHIGRQICRISSWWKCWLVSKLKFTVYETESKSCDLRVWIKKYFTMNTLKLTYLIDSINFMLKKIMLDVKWKINILLWKSSC